MRIKEIKSMMDEYKVSYWEASEIFESYDRFYRDYTDDDYMYLQATSHKWNFNIYDKNKQNKIVKLKSFIKNISSSILLIKKSEEHCNICPSCGSEDSFWQEEDEYFGYYTIDEIFKILNNVEKTEKTSANIKIEKRCNIDKNNVYIITMDIFYISAKFCDDCEEQSNMPSEEEYFYDDKGVYKDDNVYQEFKDHVWSHGLNTGFTCQCDNSMIIERYHGILNNPKWQICCSDTEQHIGSIGLYVKGYTHYVSNTDLWSRVDKNGNRVFRIDEDTDLIKKEDEICLDMDDHIEAIVSKPKILGIWVKDWFLDKPEGKRLWEYLQKDIEENGWFTTICSSRRDDI